MNLEFEKKFKELFHKQNKNNFEFQEMDKFRDLFKAELEEEIKDLSLELKNIGIKKTDPWDLVNSKEKYPKAIDILVKHLSLNYHDKNKEGIIRALAVKEAIGKANKALKLEYEKTPKEKLNLRWVIGNSIEVTMTLEDIPWLIKQVLDKTNGESRSRLIAGLSRLKSKEVENTLIQLLDDEQVLPQTLSAIKKMKSKALDEKVALKLTNQNLKPDK